MLRRHQNVRSRRTRRFGVVEQEVSEPDNLALRFRNARPVYELLWRELFRKHGVCQGFRDAAA